MGKRITARKRGRGTLRYRAPIYTTRYEYPAIEKSQSQGKIIDITHERGKSAPVSTIQFENGKTVMLPAPMGIRVNDEVTLNSKSIDQQGSILPLSQIPDGTSIFAIEKNPGSGPIFCRAAGAFAKVVGRIGEQVIIEFPSKKQKTMHPQCRASIGVVAGAGRKEKPIIKAGKRYYMMKAKNKLYPVVSAVCKNARDHPFGSGRGKHIGKPKNAPRNAPPGRNVGLISARRSGRRR
jgi:large subunit ribosomal protein L2